MSEQIKIYPNPILKVSGIALSVVIAILLIDTAVKVNSTWDTLVEGSQGFFSVVPDNNPNPTSSPPPQTAHIEPYVGLGSAGIHGVF